jgi:pyridoxal phosphate enzyme (YggS family)
MSSIRTNIEQIDRVLQGSSCKLIAVTKTKPVDMLLEAYEAGCKMFGENKVQEMVSKYEVLPQDIEWHLIGHLQSNKVKYIAPFVSLIHSIDTFKLLQEVNKQAQKVSRIIPCLLQIHIAEEETKFGLSFEEAETLLQMPELAHLQNIKISGLMGMATFTENAAQIRKEFRGLKRFFDKLRTHPLTHNVEVKELSMGMSGDYQIAIEEGSTLIRVGSSIFGAR